MSHHFLHKYLNENNDDPILIHHANLNELEFDENSDCNETEDNKRIKKRD